MYYIVKDIKSGSLFLVRQTDLDDARSIAKRYLGTHDFTIVKATIDDIVKAVPFQNNVAPMRKP